MTQPKGAQKAKPIEPEVLPAVQAGDEYAERFINFHLAGEQHASAAVYCAAAAGAVAAQKKRGGKHGEFIPWVRSLRLADGRVVTPRTVQRYMALAREIAERISSLPQAERVRFVPPDEKRHAVPLLSREDLPTTSVMELLAGFDPTKTHELTNAAIAQAVKQIVGEETLRQLYFDWGITKQSKTGHQKYTPPKNLTDQEKLALEAEGARKAWMHIRDVLEADGLKECTWGRLSKAEQEAVAGLLDEVSTTIKKSLRGKRE